MSVVYLEERSDENIKIVEHCLEQNLEFWNSLTTRIYYAVFQRIKAKLFNWYVDLHWPSDSETHFFAHHSIDVKLDEYIEFHKITLNYKERMALKRITDLQTARLDADYGSKYLGEGTLQETITEEDIRQYLVDAKEIIAIISKLKA
jgi:uncharacterized protein (UPF0332 family)